MIINIISKQADRERITGPKKVLVNACKGFDELGVKYVFNEPMSEHRYNWIHDDPVAVIEAGFIGNPVVAGPNIAVLPKDLPIFRKKLHPNSIYLHPSDWAADVWRFLNFKECRLAAWPVGVDMGEFDFIKRARTNKVLIYLKERDEELLRTAKDTLERLGYDATIIHYGRYKQEDYQKALSVADFGIWIGRCESQGIALQEALSTDLPLIVVDALSLFDVKSEIKKGYVGYDFPKKLSSIKTSSAPYFDDRCGIKINSIDELETAIAKMEAKYADFKPREFIESELSLSGRAEELLDYLRTVGGSYKPQKKNFKKLAKILFYAGLVFQKWAWAWVITKIKTKVLRK